MYVCDEQYRGQYQEQIENNGWIEWQRTNNVIHGGGFALKMYQQVSGALPCCILFKYLSEGDNRCDAVDLMKQLSWRIDAPVSDETKIVVPVSWKAMFGNEPTEQLY